MAEVQIMIFLICFCSALFFGKEGGKFIPIIIGIFTLFAVFMPWLMILQFITITLGYFTGLITREIFIAIYKFLRSTYLILRQIVTLTFLFFQKLIEYKIHLIAPFFAFLLIPMEIEHEQTSKTNLTREIASHAEKKIEFKFPSPSFDCEKSKTDVEKMICSDIELVGLDNDLAIIYKNRSAKPNNRAQLINDQVQWLNSRNLCTSTECIKNSYKERIAYLLQ